MSNVVPPIPIKDSVTDQNGFMSTAWTGFLVEMYKRIGGTVAPTNLELSTGSTTLQATVTTHTTQIASIQAAINGLNQGPVL